MGATVSLQAAALDPELALVIAALVPTDSAPSTDAPRSVPKRPCPIVSHFLETSVPGEGEALAEPGLCW